MLIAVATLITSLTCHTLMTSALTCRYVALLRHGAFTVTAAWLRSDKQTTDNRGALQANSAFHPSWLADKLSSDTKICDQNFSTMKMAEIQKISYWKRTKRPFQLEKCLLGRKQSLSCTVLPE